VGHDEHELEHGDATTLKLEWERRAGEVRQRWEMRTEVRLWGLEEWSWPVADLGEDDPGGRVVADLVRWSVRPDLVRRGPGRETPVIIHHIRRDENGAVHSFSARCPFCGRRLPDFEPVPLEGVEERLPLVPAAQVCFFDRDSEGSLQLAEHCAARGALVVWEPNYAGPEVQLARALSAAHVLKFARDRVPDLANQPLDGPLLVIETLGADGLRYQDRRTSASEWQHLPAVPVPVVRDAGGSGDWCTAGLMHHLGRGGLAGFCAASADDLRTSLRFGQALAAWNCAFEGARGGMYVVDRERFRRDVAALLAGEVLDPGQGGRTGGQDGAGMFCPGCSLPDATNSVH
jgi:fructokinase